MTSAAWIALVVGAAGMVLNVMTLAVGYGVLRGTVTACRERITAMEAEIGTLNEMRIQVTKIETRLDGLLEQFKDLNASIRWMREPAGAYDAAPLPNLTPPRRKGAAGGA